MNIYVGNLPHSTTEQELIDLFTPYGNVTSGKIVTDRDTGQSRGFGFVELEGDGNEAINKLNGSDLGGRPLVVNEARPRTEGGGGGGGYRGGSGGGYNSGNRGNSGGGGNRRW